jgi:hypothetical protein
MSQISSILDWKNRRNCKMGNTDFIETTNKAEDVAQHYNKGMEFIEELLRENERLRYKLIHVNQEMADITNNGSSVLEMEDELSKLRALREMIQGQFDHMKKENLEFRQRYTELEKQNESFMNLFVSSCQIHSSLDEEIILLTMQEIALHMVGAEVFSVWMVDQDSGSLEIIASTDEDGQFNGQFPDLDDEMLRNLAAGKVSYFSYEGKEAKQFSDPLACIPLMMEGRTIGAIVIYKLLVQKSGFTNLDNELLDLLATQAVTALVGARCYARTDCDPRFLETDR